MSNNTAKCASIKITLCVPLAAPPSGQIFTAIELDNIKLHRNLNFVHFGDRRVVPKVWAHFSG